MERTGLYRLPDEISFPCPGRRQSPIPAALVVLLGCTARWYPGPARLYCETAWGTRPGCFNWQEAVYTPGGSGGGGEERPLVPQRAEGGGLGVVIAQPRPHM